MAIFPDPDKNKKSAYQICDLYRARKIENEHNSIIFEIAGASERINTFIKDIEKVLQKLPSKKQTMLFSATMPKEVSKLAKDILVNPIRVDVTPKKIILDQIKQYVYLIDTGNKMNLLLDLLKSKKMTHTIIFRKTKRGANYLGQKLYRSGFRAETIHGDKTQAARQRALRQFEKGRAKILVATDVAARGIDFSRVSHVVNYELPNIPENYIHRIGRTARAGSEGVAYSFCDVSEMSFLRNIERKSKQKNHPIWTIGMALNPEKRINIKTSVKAIN